jgi:hypothetical protein
MVPFAKLPGDILFYRLDAVRRDKIRCWLMHATGSGRRLPKTFDLLLGLSYGHVTTRVG